MTEEDAPLADASDTARVLIVEDDDAMRRLMAATLDAFGYDVVEAGDGIDLLGWLGASLWDPSGDCVDVIVSDVNLPDMTALEVMEALRLHHGAVPVILVTASDDPTVDERAYDLGASIVLRKPFDVADLGALVTRVRRRDRAIPGARRPHGPDDVAQDE
jgi:CheY-like chemotaxis protein